MIRDATLSACGKFRFTLVREWNPARPRLLFIMLNPSTADADVDDQTIRKCVTFAQRLGFGSIEVVNLFAYRATNPIDLKRAGWPVGEGNDLVILGACTRAAEVICAWGAHARASQRAADVLEMISPWCHPLALAVTDDGVPKHPLYLRGDSKPFPL